MAMPISDRYLILAEQEREEALIADALSGQGDCMEDLWSEILRMLHSNELTARDAIEDMSLKDIIYKVAEKRVRDESRAGHFFERAAELQADDKGGL